LAAAATCGLAGCDAVRDATDAAGQATDKASICVDALRLAGFSPDLSDPEQAVKDAQKTSEDLARLAGQTPDEALRTALTDMSRKVGELGPDDMNPASITRWADEKVNTLDALTRACA
ncbi:MAG TPA: bacteriophage spanin2 family protein, partial [Actinophytocola sp.]|uniref:bacteriophage spanin2 family protein n=1 Tax=Actinophytocola sp. TaxID=1872138 RepID=UPI002DDD0243